MCVSDEPTAEAIADEAAALGREIDADTARKLAIYLFDLMKWNRSLNLVGTADWRRALAELVADSWSLADFLDELLLPDDPLCLDVGAGAGLPGIPLRLFWPRGEYVLIESRQKRVAFLKYVLSRIDLARTRAVRSRAENLDPELKRADLVVGRAVMPWRDFLNLAAGLLAPGGRCVIFANHREPDAKAPDCFQSGPTYAYEAAGGKRYFWSFSVGTPAICSR
jgi:16S rRNA (guanine527-N7)-methyltransferase